MSWSQEIVAVLSQEDAQVVLGIIAGIPTTIAAIAAYNASQAKKAARGAEYQLSRNAGSTPADAVDRIESKVDKLATVVDELIEIVTTPTKERKP